jgi:hypothetical protein
VFYQVGKTVTRDHVPDKDPGVFYNTQVFLMSEEVTHKRKVYGWMDLLGDLGGVTEVVMICFGFFLFPISEHSFYIKAINKMFLARSTDKSLFAPPKTGDLTKAKKLAEDKEIAAEIENHHPVHIRFLDSVRLFIANQLGCLFCNCLWSKKRQYQRLYDKGQERIEEQLDIVKLLRNLKDMNILLKSSLMSKKVLFDIQHAENYLIDVDHSSSESSESDSHQKTK